jgi:hypothetical protein
VNFFKKTFLPLFLFSSLQTFSAPVDWHGVLGFGTTVIDNYNRLDKIDDTSASDIGTLEVPLGSGQQANANFQSYLFRLEPTIIVNDAASVKAEFTSGYARGGRMGDSSTQAKEPGFGNSLYPYNFSSSEDGLVIDKLYMELYADTATYLIGRHTANFALGALINSGDGIWDRHSYLRDGITVKVKLGSFHISPFWSRVGSLGSLTKTTRIKEYGFSLVYDNAERDMAFGLLYAKKQNAPYSGQYLHNLTTAQPGAGGNYSGFSSLGKTDVKMTDFYFKKSFGQFDFGLEVPIMSGEVGNVFTADTKYKAKAIIFESNLKLGDRWKVSAFGGQVSGDDGGATSFEAMYLNPNYQVANLLFRYNLRAVANPDDSTTAANVYDSYIHNARYLKLAGQYNTEKWTWDFALIKAWAEETATSGKTSYTHMTNKTFTAVASQSDDIGTEVDLSFTYNWNDEITIGGDFGYLVTGDYFGFNNTTTPNAVDNSYIMQLKTAVSF